MDKLKLTVDEQIRQRLIDELQKNQRITKDQDAIDEVLLETTTRLEEYVKVIIEELGRQRAAMGHLAEVREQQADLLHHRKETANLGINLADVFFRSDIELLIRHLGLADEKTIKKALLKDSSALSRLRQLIQQIDEME